jgi:hypothetical protein
MLLFKPFESNKLLVCCEGGENTSVSAHNHLLIDLIIRHPKNYRQITSPSVTESKVIPCINMSHNVSVLRCPLLPSVLSCPAAPPPSRCEHGRCECAHSLSFLHECNVSASSEWSRKTKTLARKTCYCLCHVMDVLSSLNRDIVFVCVRRFFTKGYCTCCFLSCFLPSFRFFTNFRCQFWSFLVFFLWLPSVLFGFSCR